MEARIVKPVERLARDVDVEGAREKGFVPFLRELPKEDLELQLRERLVRYASRICLADPSEGLALELMEVASIVEAMRELRGWPADTFHSIRKVAGAFVYIDCMEGPDLERQ